VIKSINNKAAHSVINSTSYYCRNIFFSALFI